MKIIYVISIFISMMISTNLVAEVTTSPSKAVVFISCEYLYSNGEKEPASRGSGAIISRFGHVLTARHVLYPQEVKNTKVECKASLGSRTEYPRPLVPEMVGSSLADAAIGVFHGAQDGNYKHLALCDSNQVRGSHSVELGIIGFPLDADRTTIHTQIINFKGPKSTWLVQANLLRGTSGAPVLNKDGEIIAIAIGGQDSISGYSNILPEYLFRDSIKSIIQWCSKPTQQKVRWLKRKIKFQVDEINNTHEPFNSSTRRYTRTFSPEPNCTFEALTWKPSSENNLLTRSVEIVEDGKRLIMHFSLEAGPAYDTWRGWIHGEILATQKCRA